MAPSHSVEGSLGGMAAAVSEDHTLSSSLYTPRPSFHLPMPTRTLRGRSPHLGGDPDPRQELPPENHAHPAPFDNLDPRLATIVGNSPSYHYEQHFPEHIRKAGYERRSRSRSPTSKPPNFDSYRQLRSSSDMELTHSFGPESVTVTRNGHLHNYPYMDNSIDGELRKKSLNLTDQQNHHMRHSPPIQPGEQSYSHQKLPSFEEFCHGTGHETTPPQTPNRRDRSIDNSPRTQPHFEDIPWQDKHKRDTLGEIFTHPPPTGEPLPRDPRRMSSAIDPALHPYHSRHYSPQSQAQPSGQSQQYRASLPYSHAAGSSVPQIRHQSSPGPQSHPGFQQPHPTMVADPHSVYSAQPSQYGAVYDPRPRHHHELATAPHPHTYDRQYDRPYDSYYGGSSYGGAHHPGYDNGYSEYRFHNQHTGNNYDSFHRKRRGNLPKDATNLLKEWFAANRASPYPTEDQKNELCAMTTLSINQVSNWFINARRRQPQKDARERESNGAEA